MAVFGREAASGALVLIDGAQRLGDFGEELRNVDGAAADAAKTMRDSLGGDFNSLKSAVEGLMIAIGDAGLTALLRTATQALTDVARAFTVVANNADYLITGVALLGATHLPALIASTATAVTWLGTMEGLMISGAIASRGLAAAMNLIPGVALFAGATFVLTEVISGFRNGKIAAEEYAGAIGLAATAQDTLSTAMTTFYQNTNQQNLNAMLLAAQTSRDQVKVALEAAKTQLEAAVKSATFGFAFKASRTIVSARENIRDLELQLLDAEGMITLADHAASNFQHMLERTGTTAADTGDQLAEAGEKARKMLATMQDQNTLQHFINKFGRDSIEVATLRAEQERRNFLATLDTMGATEELRAKLIGVFDVGQDLAAIDYANSLNNGAGAADSLSRGLSRAGSLAARLVATLGQVPAAVASIAGQVDGAIGALTRQNRSLSYQMKDGLTSAAAGIKALRAEALDAARESGATINELYDISGSFDEQIAQAEKLATANSKITETLSERAAAEAKVRSSISGGGRSKKPSGAGGIAEAAKAANTTRDALKALRDEHTALQATIGMTAQQEAIYTAQQKLGASATAAQRAEVSQLIPKIEALKGVKERMKAVSDEVRSGIKTMFHDGIKGAESFKDAFSSMIDSIASKLLDSGIDQMLDNIIGKLDGKSSGGGWFGSLLKGFGFGQPDALSSALAGIPGVPTYANGTQNHPGGWARMNERGGEIVKLPGGSQVIPHDISKMVAANTGRQPANTNVTIDLRGTTGDKALDQKMAALAAQIMQETEDRTPGWLHKYNQEVAL